MQQFAAQEIGERIQLARKERGLTQDELAAMSSFSKRSLQDYETGVTIPYRHLRELSQLLGRREEWFLYGDDAASPDARLDRLERLVSEIQETLKRILTLLGGHEDQPRAGQASPRER